MDEVLKAEQVAMVGSDVSRFVLQEAVMCCMRKVDHSNIDGWIQSGRCQRLMQTTSAYKCCNIWRPARHQIIVRSSGNGWTNRRALSAVSTVIHDEQGARVEPKSAVLRQQRQQLPQPLHNWRNQFRSVSVSVKKKLAQGVAHSADIQPSAIILIVTDIFSGVCMEDLQHSNQTCQLST